MKIRIDPLDSLVSEYIRRKSKGYCQRCGTYYGWKSLQCCHFHGRGQRSTRYDEDNLIALDFGCHQYIDSHPMEKIEFFKNLLGQERFDMLNARARVPARFIDKKALTLYYRLGLKQLEE